MSGGNNQIKNDRVIYPPSQKAAGFAEDGCATDFSPWGSTIRGRNGKSLLAEDYPAFGEIVGGYFQRYFVADGNSDEMFAHLAGNMGKNFIAVLKSDPVHRRRQNFDDHAIQAESFFFCLMTIFSHNPSLTDFP